MTQLTDKMEGLRLKQGEAVPFQAIHFNQAIDECIALVKAEAAVVGDWEGEFEKYKEPTELNGTVYYRLPINKLTHLLTATREAGAKEEREKLKLKLWTAIDDHNCISSEGVTMLENYLTPPIK